MRKAQPPPPYGVSPPLPLSSFSSLLSRIAALAPRKKPATAMVAGASECSRARACCSSTSRLPPPRSRSRPPSLPPPSRPGLHRPVTTNTQPPPPPTPPAPLTDRRSRFTESPLTHDKSRRPRREPPSQISDSQISSSQSSGSRNRSELSMPMTRISASLIRVDDSDLRVAHPSRGPRTPRRENKVASRVPR